MIRISMSHYTALSQAEMFIQPSLTQNMEPRHRQAVERNLVLIGEVKAFILQELYNPKLPLKQVD